MESIKIIEVKIKNDLLQNLLALNANQDLRAVILKFEDERSFIDKFKPDKEIIELVKYFQVPVISIINESAGGFVFEIMLATHICIASNKAKFVIDKKKHLLDLQIGSKNIEKLKLIGNEFNAETALDLGIINKIAIKDNLEKESLEMAEKIGKLAPLAIRSCLQAVNQGIEMDLEDGLKLETELFSKIFATEDMREGTSAFLEKRKPIFTGK